MAPQYRRPICRIPCRLISFSIILKFREETYILNSTLYIGMDMISSMNLCMCDT